MNSLWNTNMKTLIQAAVVTLFAASAAQAQQAVQWRVQDGGNGHWYMVLGNGTTLGWSEARQMALARGADLASTETLAEWNFAKLIITADGAWNGGHGPWLGGYQDYSQPDFSEPAGGWRWVSGHPMVFTAWWPNGPQPSNSCNGAPEDFLHVIDRASPGWNDIGEPSTCQVSPPRAAVLEWSADCNNDGIVDFGQIRDGIFPDSNGNGVPDCCEGGGSCCVGDILADRVINGADLGALLAYWGPVTSSPISRSCDLNGDNVVSGADIALLLAGWGNCP